MWALNCESKTSYSYNTRTLWILWFQWVPSTSSPVIQQQLLVWWLPFETTKDIEWNMSTTMTTLTMSLLPAVAQPALAGTITLSLATIAWTIKNYNIIHIHIWREIHYVFSLLLKSYFHIKKQIIWILQNIFIAHTSMLLLIISKICLLSRKM